MSAQVSLQEWNERLSDHFRRLAARRKAAGWPLFALEHGLSPDEMRAFETSVRSAARSAPPNHQVDVAWVVYAAEFGYRYAGDQYWQTFASETPGWKDRRWDRDFLRDAFAQFANVFNGAKPEGAWAKCFSIIAWPVTHGILPKDLQRQLVKLLYESRYTLRAELFSSASALGKHLELESEEAAPRFRVFADNTLLLGQIAAALLTQEPGDDGLISADTLTRIVDDINRERISREHLNDARSSARMLRVKGLSAREGPAASRTEVDAGASDSETASIARITAPQASMLMRFRLGTRWDVVLEIPDLSPVLRSQPTLRTILSHSRARVVGSATPNIARGRLLQGGAQRLQVTRWPARGELLVAFESGSPEVRNLEESFRWMDDDKQLFRVREDGYAHRSTTRLVHPGYSYILLQREPVSNPPQGCAKIDVECEGIFGLTFSLPSPLTDRWENLLLALKLQSVRTLKVWPAGTPPAMWDGLGRAEWLTPDEPTLGIAVDHGFDAIEVCLSGTAPQLLQLPLEGKSQEIFLCLGGLSNGDYRLKIRTLAKGQQVNAIAGYLEFRIRAPGANIRKSQQRALQIVVHPTAPSLEELWENSVDLAVLGPPETKLNCNISLGEKSGPVPLFSKELSKKKLPLEPIDWAVWFQREILSDRRAQLAYDASTRCNIQFRAGFVGTGSIVAEREFTPLRWTVRVTPDFSMVKLFDDSGAPDVQTTFCDFRTPDKLIRLEYEEALAGMRVTLPGGLYMAATKDHRAGAVIDLTLGKVQLSQLRVQPVVRRLNRNGGELDQFIRIAADWERARLKGSVLGPLHKADVLAALISELFSAICGEKWATFERRLVREPQQSSGILRDMKGAISDKPGERSLGGALDAAMKDFVSMGPQARVGLFASRAVQCIPGVVSSYNSAPSSRLERNPMAIQRRTTSSLFDFALRAASSPGSLIAFSGGELEPGLTRLLERPVLARAARYVVLGVNDILAENLPPTGNAYTGWQW